MKTPWLALMAAAAIPLSGCGNQSSDAQTTAPTTTTGVTVTAPADEDPIVEGDDTSVHLPQAEADANTIPWADAKQLIRACKVDHLMQPHTGQVQLTLEDGRNVNTIEPHLDDVLHLADKVESRCGRIVAGVE